MRSTVLALLLAVGWGTAAAADTGAWYQVEGGAWAVPPDVTNAAATQLQQAADHAPGPPRIRVRPVADYTVQYQGTVVDGKRLVRLAGACSTMGRSPGDLARQWLVVFDGGNCYFDAQFDPAHERFVSFSFHGRA